MRPLSHTFLAPRLPPLRFLQFMQPLLLPGETPTGRTLSSQQERQQVGMKLQQADVFATAPRGMESAGIWYDDDGNPSPWVCKHCQFKSFSRAEVLGPFSGHEFACERHGVEEAPLPVPRIIRLQDQVQEASGARMVQSAQIQMEVEQQEMYARNQEQMPKTWEEDKAVGGALSRERFNAILQHVDQEKEKEAQAIEADQAYRRKRILLNESLAKPVKLLTDTLTMLLCIDEKGNDGERERRKCIVHGTPGWDCDVCYPHGVRGGVVIYKCPHGRQEYQYVQQCMCGGREEVVMCVVYRTACSWYIVVLNEMRGCTRTTRPTN